MTVATPDCPHCGAVLGSPVRHCIGVENKQCDWLVCPGCKAVVSPSQRTHTHIGARGGCKKEGSRR